MKDRGRGDVEIQTEEKGEKKEEGDDRNRKKERRDWKVKE